MQQGGTKALLNLAQVGTAKGTVCAAQALARIASTINPEVAFSGQRVSRNYLLFANSISLSNSNQYHTIVRCYYNLRFSNL